MKKKEKKICIINCVFKQCTKCFKNQWRLLYIVRYKKKMTFLVTTYVISYSVLYLYFERYVKPNKHQWRAIFFVLYQINRCKKKTYTVSSKKTFFQILEKLVYVLNFNLFYNEKEVFLKHIYGFFYLFFYLEKNNY